MNKKKWLSGTVLSTVLLTTVLTACGQNDNNSNAGASSGAVASPSASASASPSDSGSSGEKVKLTVAVFAEELDFWQQQIAAPSFAAALPNVTVDLQSFANADELTKTMKIRQAANEFPDVTYLKAANLIDFQNTVAPWKKDDPLVTSNKFVGVYDNNKATGGDYYGLPMKVMSDWVYYRKSVFEELGLQIPKTWPEFVELATKIKDSGKYTPIAMGGKDKWPVYPFVEWLPEAIGKSQPTLLSDLAKSDRPFTPDSPFSKAFGKFEQLINADVLGKALDTSWTDAENMLVNKKAAMFVAGNYFYPDYVRLGGDVNDLGVFPIPDVDTESETITQVGQVDLFFVLGKNSSHPNEARKLVEWFLSNDVYGPYIERTGMVPTVDVQTTGKKTVFQEAADTLKYEQKMLIPGDENFNKIRNEVQFDTHVIGQYMLTGKDYQKQLDALNDKWEKARKKLGIQ
ncbi:ABC transporter substrate-binding protein [Cohnella suwonensis]|uniref:ABC transporter substrate-binding protein n=1 Tax=Cohnella suwonensis TaxID=696072 RepID=A0ABW0M0V9_9BACL